MDLKYFDISEFDSPDEKGSGNYMDSGLLYKIDLLRERYGKPIRITSGYRTESHNAAVGGVSNSSHLQGLAVDIACTASGDRHDIINEALKLGFNRIGIANTFLHLDVDTAKPSGCVWVYN